MNLKLDLDPKKLIAALQLAEPYIVGAALIAVFGFTATVVNVALNPKPAATGSVTTVQPSSKISFDKTTINALHNLEVVKGDVPTGALGKDDPFK